MNSIGASQQTKPPQNGLVSRLLLEWVSMVTAHAWLIVACLVLTTVISSWISIALFKMNSDMEDLIRQTGSWRNDFEAYKAEFPLLVDTAVIVVSGTSFDAVEQTSKDLTRRIEAQVDNFQDVFSITSGGFFRDHALMYMDIDDLEEMADRLAEAQPVLTAVAEDSSLRGVLKLLVDGIENEPAAGFTKIVELLARSAEAVNMGGDPRISWTDELFDTDGEKVYQVVLLKARKNFEATLPNKQIMLNLRKIISDADIKDSVNVSITGEIALSHEEIEAAQAGVKIAGIVSIALLTLILGIGIRSWKIVVATFLMLFAGISWTSAFAMLTVGEYNTLSLIFLVMFFGLGVDFAIHYCLRYHEAVTKTNNNDMALRHASGSVGKAILLCTITTAIGFLGFVPTDYSALSDLGIISAGGMFVAAFLTFTLLPAFFTLVGAPAASSPVLLLSAEKIVGVVIRNKPAFLGLLAMFTLLAAYQVRDVHFDFSVLALRNPDSESMLALTELQQEGLVTDYSLSIVSDKLDQSWSDLESLDAVEKVTTPISYVPENQEDKLYVLEDLQLLLLSALEPTRVQSAPSDAQLKAAVAALRSAIATGDLQDEKLGRNLARLDAALARILEMGPGAVQIWQSAALDNLKKELGWLRRALTVSAISFKDLPNGLKSRLIGQNGQYLTVVLPQESIADVDALSRFVESVRAVAPTATGRPAIEWGVGKIVVRSFQTAMFIAIVCISLILFISLRSLVDTILVLIPLFLTGLFTLASTVVFNMPINMASVLVLPLIFGLGVDNGIHVVERYRSAHDVSKLMHSSTPRAVLLSTLTTIATFAALSLSPHRGTASIGLLLTVAILFLLVFTVILLPALLSLRARGTTHVEAV